METETLQPKTRRPPRKKARASTSLASAAMLSLEVSRVIYLICSFHLLKCYSAAGQNRLHKREIEQLTARSRVARCDPGGGNSFRIHTTEQQASRASVAGWGIRKGTWDNPAVGIPRLPSEGVSVQLMMRSATNTSNPQVANGGCGPSQGGLVALGGEQEAHSGT